MRPSTSPMPPAAWGKLQQEEGQWVAWHPLVDHCADVAACCEALLQRTLLRQRLARLGGLPDLGPRQVDRLCVFAALHDFGKANLGFQNKCLPGPERPLSAGHLGEALGGLCHGDDDTRQRLFNALRLSEISGWLEGPGDEDEVLFQFLVATVSHHGQPVLPRTDCSSKLWRADGSRDPIATVEELVAATEVWFPEAWEVGGPRLPATPELQHGWAGLLMLADWLGSDTRTFELSNGQGGDRMPRARELAAISLREIGMDAGLLRPALGEAPPGYECFTDFLPRPVQARMLEISPASEGSTVVMEAATGAGKTEAAIAHFLRLFQAGHVDGLYFALPTRAAARQIYGRICDAIKRAFPNPESRPPVVSAMPGYLAVDAIAGVPLPGFQVLWDETKAGEPVRRRGWAAEHPKRYFAGAVVVGTVDQALLSSLQVSHAHLRATALLRHLLVIDEVHASDSYMTSLLEEVLNRHRQAGGHALLMSATLGSVARARLLNKAPESCTDAIAIPYPALWHQSSEGTNLMPVAATGSSKGVRFEVAAEIDKAAAIAERALAAAREGARVLIIRNTVSGCQETQAELEKQASATQEDRFLFTCPHAEAGSEIPAPHHSRFAKVDREALDEAMELAYGKHRDEGGLVVVATQTVEQSLDIDADYLITDLAPIDVLLQRVGRLHRHSRKDRPAAYEQAVTRVLVPTEDMGDWIQPKGEVYGQGGLGSVYEDLRILERTRRLLLANSRVTIPRDNRLLVEEATHPERLESLVAELGDLWDKHRAHVRGTSLAQGRIAELCLLRRDRPFSDQPDGLFPQGEQSRKIATRLGSDDRIVRFTEAPLGPFGRPIPEMKIPGHLVEKAQPPAEAEEITHVETLPDEFRFTFGNWKFRYTRLGIQRLS